MSRPVCQMKLKEWLIAQVDSSRYPGLRWENEEKTIFRIPWKHAAKQDYREQDDAALFKAWAVYKRKFHEGTDKADPSTWKTRLRCALNKSTDFKEIPERSQMDISEPYKVYRVLTDKHTSSEDSPMEVLDNREQRPKPPPVKTEVNGQRHVADRAKLGSGLERDKTDQPAGTGWASPELPAPRMPSEPLDHGYQVRGHLYGWTSFGKHTAPPDPYHILNESRNASDFWLHIRLYYRDVLVKEFTTRTVEGCRITHRPTPADDDQLYGPSYVEQLPFPSPRVLGVCRVPEIVPVLERLLLHLDRGVLLWVAPDGVFVKRQCQGRVYWSGPMAPNKDQPNKLEREKECKVLDTQRFLQELQVFLRNGEPAPRYQIRLCFGEEYPEASSQNSTKLITAHIEPVFARELFLLAQQMGSRLQDGEEPSESSAPDGIVRILRHLCRS
ncbi:interferon regulatory factor 4-like isoform X2 [Ambystoma mexicanum]|uniref:interferon regulatory factor 4-like isoform X2 n=1 Tax=Ambystoma mexicanum TaxID=8296 RepID=UPI0037E9672A